MARRFVLVPGVGVPSDRYIVAEIVCDPQDPTGDGMAREFAGPNALILSFEELNADPDGRFALAAWESGNDHRHDTDSYLLAFGASLDSKGLHAVDKRIDLTDAGLIRNRYRQTSLLSDRLLEQNERLRAQTKRLVEEMFKIRAENRSRLQLNRTMRRPFHNVIPIDRGRRVS
jgi:hypothetical protein